MISKLEEKEKAVFLRKQGKTYREILEEVPVAKSTLSIWLRSVELAKKQKQRITRKRLECAIKGGEVRRKQMIENMERIYKESAKDIKSISKKELWLMGVMLYWAEGSKEKKGKKSIMMKFCNTDSRMINMFLLWTKDVIKIEDDRLHFRIHIHENSKDRIETVREYWSKQTGFDINRFRQVTWKRHNPKTNRKFNNIEYFGLLEIGIRKSSNLVRQVEGWVRGITCKLTK
ncbi:MAG: hypothetical protein ACI9GH_000202 [Candidatus Paceibacteria bacterium]|jgi:hypothetical protein